jgi:hypothetical protein
MGFYYQKNTKDPSAAKCGSKDFWKSIRLSSTPWNIDTRRAILKAVENDDQEAMQQWMAHTDYRKFELKTLKDLKPAGKEKWKKKPDAKKLLAWADDLKKTLPAFEFCCYEFDEVKRKRKNKAGKMVEVTERPRQLIYCHLNGLVMLDIDHVDNPMEVWEKLQQSEALMARVVLVHLTSSGKGIRIIFTADINVGNLADNQIAFCEALGGGYTPDRSCLDATRNSFAPKEEEILFINEEKLFNYYDEEFDKKYTPLYRDKKTQPLYHQFPADDADGDAVHTKTADVAPANAKQGTGEERSVDAGPMANNDVKWRGYDVQSIIDARYADKLPCADDSNRHTESLKLATDLLLMLDGDKQRVQRIVEAQTWVQEIIDERNENVTQTVDSAADCVAQKERKYASSLPSKSMLEAIRKVTGKTYQEITKSQEKKEATTISEDDINARLWDWGDQIEELSEHYPLLKDICKGLKKNQYPAALVVAGGMMMTLMTRCNYRFYHRPEELRRLNCSALIIGDPASGKSFATRLYKLLMKPVFESDKIGKDAINAYREEMRTKGANKEKPKKPKVVIQIHPSRTSNAQFTQDMINAVTIIDGVEIHLHMFTFDTELDNTLAIQKGGSWIDKQSLELKAFHNEEDGVAFSNNDSIFQDFNVYWNFIYTGTPIALKKKVNEQNFGSGLATRLTCIPLPATNFQMLSREPQVDVESDERLSEWAYKLDKTKGELPVQKLVDELYDWTERRMLDAQENDSKADEMLLKRCAYHGLNFAAPFIVMRHWNQMKKDGDYWTCEFETDEVDWQLAELIVNMQYACQRHYFGALAETYFDNKKREIATNVMRREKTVEAFSRLPEEFVVEDVVRCFSMKDKHSARARLARLMKDRYVEKVEEYLEDGFMKAKYKKTGKLML